MTFILGVKIMVLILDLALLPSCGPWLTPTGDGLSNKAHVLPAFNKASSMSSTRFCAWLHALLALLAPLAMSCHRLLLQLKSLRVLLHELFLNECLPLTPSSGT